MKFIILSVYDIYVREAITVLISNHYQLLSLCWLFIAQLENIIQY